MTLDSVTFRKYTLDMIEVGRQDMAIQLGLVKDKISQRQAYKRFGEARVKTWETRKLIQSTKEKGATYYRDWETDRKSVV